MKIDNLRELVRNRFPWIGKNIILLGALGILAVFLFLNITMYFLGRNMDFAWTGKYPVKIPSGMSTYEISEVLHKMHLVKNPKAFRMEARLKGLQRSLQAGLYSVDGGMSNSQIIDIFFKGKVQIASLTVPEGFTVAKIAKVLERKGLGNAQKFCQLAKDYAPYDYMQTKRKSVIYKAEGFLYPAVYEFPASYAEGDILALMVRTFHEEMEKTGIFGQSREKNLQFRDVVNLAAMVELEAVFKEEQPLIAGVFRRRLEIGMPIQSDTTIQYILGGDQKEIITWKDTEISNPYNTYQNYGLPPGPIGSPGMDAIKAVLNPKQSKYLYFVAERDGHHRFTATYSEHLRAIRDIDNGR